VLAQGCFSVARRAQPWSVPTSAHPLPQVRAFSSWKFLRKGYMRPEGGTGEGRQQGAPCVRAGWADFCGDPLLLGRVCAAQRHCCDR
jgi:hypothetical protein